MSNFKKTLGGAWNSQAPHHDSVIPPPPHDDGLRPSRAPRGSRTPSLEQASPELVQELPDDALPWMKRARRLVAALEVAIHDPDITDAQRAAVERAWSAYEMGGATDTQIAKVAHLCERAHEAIRDRFQVSAKDAYQSCAEVLRAGLPSGVRKHNSLEHVIEVVKAMRGEEDTWVAVVDASAKLLHWNAQARQHAAQAIRAAIVTSRDR